jgi:hypothetical protein
VPLRVCAELVHRGKDLVPAPPRAQLRHSRRAQPLSRELGAQVAAALLAVPYLRERSSSVTSSSRVGGITTPSSASVRESAGMLPGTLPPTSA